jgi:hypothetical protein
MKNQDNRANQGIEPRTEPASPAGGRQSNHIENTSSQMRPRASAALAGLPAVESALGGDAAVDMPANRAADVDTDLAPEKGLYGETLRPSERED